MAPLSGGSAINFESSGTLVANLLSAAFLGFDKQGNLYVGGGDFATGADRGYSDREQVCYRTSLPEVRPSTVHLPLLWFNG